MLEGTTSTWTSSHIERARPMTSKPGPMFAEEHGTSMYGVRFGSIGLDWIRGEGLVRTYCYHCDLANV